VDTFRQFQTPVYAVFQQGDVILAGRRSSEDLILELLRRNSVLREYLRDRLEARARIAVASMKESDQGMNLAILNADPTMRVPHEIETVNRCYKVCAIPQHTMLYDKLVYPLIFWDGHGGCGSPKADEWTDATALIRKTTISLLFQPRGHFIHGLGTLREEFICSISGRLSNLRIKFLSQAEKRYFVREDEVRGVFGDKQTKEYGLRSFIPASLNDSDEYWKEVATKCFAISTQLGPPTFFLTFTMNPHWLEFQALKRGMVFLIMGIRQWRP
jgi:hypothetical protein